MTIRLFFYLAPIILYRGRASAKSSDVRVAVLSDTLEGAFRAELSQLSPRQSEHRTTQPQRDSPLVLHALVVELAAEEVVPPLDI